MEETNLGDLDIDGRITIKWILDTLSVGVYTDSLDPNLFTRASQMIFSWATSLNFQTLHA
jgi:hypothetical protein